MSFNIIVDVCKSESSKELKQLVEASKLWWSKRGYDLVTDEDGPDIMLVYEGSITDGANNKKIYDNGDAVYDAAGAVILVYQRSE